MGQISKLNSILLGLLTAVQLLPAISTTAEAASGTATLLESWDFNNYSTLADANPPMKVQSDISPNRPGITYTFVDPTGGNNKALHIYMTGDHSDSYIETNTGKLKHRTEIVMGNTRFKPHVDYWIGFKSWMSNSYPTNQGGTIGFFDVMSGSQPSESWIDTYNGDYRLSRNWYNGSFNTDKIKITPKKGRWVNFVIHTRRGWNNDGAFEVWIDGVKKTPDAWANVTTSYDIEAAGGNPPYWRFGHYFLGDRPGTVWDMYWDDVKVAEGANGYAVVDPANASAIPAAPTGLQIVTTP